MAFVSVTRLRPRSVMFLPGVLLHTWRSKKQLQRAAGFLGGYLATTPGMALWTVTVWDDETSMRAYRNTAAHSQAMPKLIAWCDEASLVHWIQDTAAIPEPAEAAARMMDGRTSKVRRPSAAHAAGDCWPDSQVPRKGPNLSP